ncbi:hypothetical protein KIPB_002189 [Kipferlia bialata]|uniref:Protein kinase domain-containing protein n=1 Tax=Kipferlia bialata TaxID=797122 RepID=A0A9K3CPT1_9EUKA|nr:hypothetical protein KIPB_002189 [Kipferlia bialata]|eukprot:g2189.t1
MVTNSCQPVEQRTESLTDYFSIGALLGSGSFNHLCKVTATKTLNGAVAGQEYACKLVNLARVNAQHRHSLLHSISDITPLKTLGSQHVVSYVDSFINSDTDEGYESCKEWKDRMGRSLYGAPFSGWHVVIMELVGGRDLGCYSLLRPCRHSYIEHGCQREEDTAMPHLLSVIEQPENIMLDTTSGGSPVVKIVGLSLSRSFRETEDLTMSDNVGTPLYRAPEMVGMDKEGILGFSGRDYGTKVDVWAAGITFTQVDPSSRPTCDMLLTTLAGIKEEYLGYLERALATVEVVREDLSLYGGNEAIRGAVSGAEGSVVPQVVVELTSQLMHEEAGRARDKASHEAVTQQMAEQHDRQIALLKDLYSRHVMREIAHYKQAYARERAERKEEREAFQEFADCELESRKSMEYLRRHQRESRTVVLPGHPRDRCGLEASLAEQSKAKCIVDGQQMLSHSFSCTSEKSLYAVFEFFDTCREYMDGRPNPAYLGGGYYGSVYKSENLKREIAAGEFQVANSPFVVKCFDHFMDSETHQMVIVMEYLPGESFKDVLSKHTNRCAANRLPHLMSIMEQPDNIMVDMSGDDAVVHIVDLGLCKPMDVGCYIKDDYRPYGSLCPETGQAQYGTKADVFSIGLICNEMVQSNWVLGGVTTRRELDRMLLAGRFDTLTDADTGVPGLAGIINSMVQWVADKLGIWEVIARPEEPQKSVPTLRRLHSECQSSSSGSLSGSGEIPMPPLRRMLYEKDMRDKNSGIRIRYMKTLQKLDQTKMGQDEMALFSAAVERLDDLDLSEKEEEQYMKFYK